MRQTRGACTLPFDDIILFVVSISGHDISSRVRFDLSLCLGGVTSSVKQKNTTKATLVSLGTYSST